MKIKYVANVVIWRDKIDGNTYHSVRIFRCSDGERLIVPFTYGYGDSYRQSALASMEGSGWLPKKYGKANAYLFERENEYPILWNVSTGLKRDCIRNGLK